MTIALSGLTALSAEVIWTRMLSLLIGATVYTFSLILAVFLLGIGIGSSVGSAMARSLAAAAHRARLVPDAAVRRHLLGGLHVHAVAAVVAGQPVARDQSLVQLPARSRRGRCGPSCRPRSCGAPASRSRSPRSRREGQDPARLVGGVYAANTVGAIIGATASSLLLVTWIGSQRSEQLLIIIAGLSALLVLEAVPAAEDGGRRSQFAGTLPIIAAAVCAALLARNVPPIPPLLVAYGRYAVTRIGQADIIYWGEGWNASVAVSRLPGGMLNYHNAGKVQASSEPQDMRLQRMLGHMTTLIPKNPKRVLVIGCGAGVTAGAASIDPRVESADHRRDRAARAARRLDLLRRAQLQRRQEPEDDACTSTTRATTCRRPSEKFDAITSDPLDPWVKGAAMLYTREFFELAKQHLNPGGVVTLFVQLYESNTEAVKSEIATFMEAFPNGVVWGNTQEGRGYDLVLLGQLTPGPINVDEIEQRLQRPEYAQVRLVAQPDRHELRGRSVLDLRRHRGRAAAVAEGREHQPRSQPAPAVPRRPRPEPVSERIDLRRHAGLRQRLSEQRVRRVGRHRERPAGRDPARAGPLAAMLKRASRNAKCKVHLPFVIQHSPCARGVPYSRAF